MAEREPPHKLSNDKKEIHRLVTRYLNIPASRRAALAATEWPPTVTAMTAPRRRAGRRPGTVHCSR